MFIALKGTLVFSSCFKIKTKPLHTQLVVKPLPENVQCWHFSVELDRAGDAVVCVQISLISQLCFQQKMPKESDESSKEEQSKIDKDGTENTAETSEEMIRKKIRRNTPSPHRLTPQCKERFDYFT